MFCSKPLLLTVETFRSKFGSEIHIFQTFIHKPSIFIKPCLQYPQWLQQLLQLIIFSHQPYTEALKLAKLEPVSERLLKLSKTFFNKIQNQEDRLHDILPTPRENPHTLRNSKIPQIFFFCNLCINPFIYIFQFEVFQQEFKKYVCFGNWNGVSPSDATTTQKTVRTEIWTRFTTI